MSMTDFHVDTWYAVLDKVCAPMHAPVFSDAAELHMDTSA